MRYVEHAATKVVSAPVGADVIRWYAVYTYPRHERSVTEHLEAHVIEAFLPSCRVKSRWKDRRVEIERVIFPCYVFARMKLHHRVTVMSIPSVIRIVSFSGAPVAIPDAEIDAVRLCLGVGAKVEQHSYIEVGERVRVRSGAFEGLEGIVLRRSNGCKLVVSIGLIHQSVALEIEAKELETINAVYPTLTGVQPSSFAAIS
jgi:transcription antitermination factor NusG